jgi:hypothetical protein
MGNNSRREIQNQKTRTLETVSQKVSHRISNESVECVNFCFAFMEVKKVNTTDY